MEVAVPVGLIELLHIINNKPVEVKVWVELGLCCCEYGFLGYVAP